MMEEREDSSGGERICGEKLIPSKLTNFWRGWKKQQGSNILLCDRSRFICTLTASAYLAGASIHTVNE